MIWCFLVATKCSYHDVKPPAMLYCHVCPQFQCWPHFQLKVSQHQTVLKIQENQSISIHLSITSPLPMTFISSNYQCSFSISVFSLDICSFLNEQVPNFFKTLTHKKNDQFIGNIWIDIFLHLSQKPTSSLTSHQFSLYWHLHRF